MTRARRGAALLEVIVALTILAIVGGSAVTAAAEASRAAYRAREADRELMRASAFLDAVALWPRADLDRHLGTRAQGTWLMRVERPHPTLYVVSLADSSTRRELLRTSLFRPETRRDAP